MRPMRVYQAELIGELIIAHYHHRRRSPAFSIRIYVPTFPNTLDGDGLTATTMIYYYRRHIIVTGRDRGAASTGRRSSRDFLRDVSQCAAYDFKRIYNVFVPGPALIVTIFHTHNIILLLCAVRRLPWCTVVFIRAENETNVI